MFLNTVTNALTCVAAKVSYTSIPYELGLINTFKKETYSLANFL